MPGGRTVLAASGTTIVPIDAVTRHVGTPLDLGVGRTVFGLALNPTNSMLYALVPGGVVPINTANAHPGAEIPTGLSVSSVYSPHGLAVTADGSRIYVAGQGGTDFGGRVLPIVAATGATLPPASFDKFGIADPAAVAVTADGGTVLVADAANNWVNPIAVATFDTPAAPARLPQRSGGSAGTQHPTDIVVGPGTTGAFLVDGFNVVVPFAPGSDVFGPPISVCSGASSMTVAPAP
jgi:DNA-binding beta-propeller fold protein YncE